MGVTGVRGEGGGKRGRWQQTACAGLAWRGKSRDLSSCSLFELFEHFSSLLFD